MKNILVLTASPRNNGNSIKLAESFIKGAKASGNTVTRFDTGKKKIGYCIACDTCWSKDTPCSFKDDFLEAAPLLEEADVIVFSTPLYWFSFPTQMKALIDKIYAYLSDDCPRPLKPKECYLLACGGDTEPQVYDGLIATYKEVISYIKWNDNGILIAYGVGPVGDIDGRIELEEAEKLGKNA